MSSEDADPDDAEAHVRGVSVTTVATLSGLAGGIVADLVATGPKDPTGVATLFAAILVQVPILRVMGYQVETFDTKDYLYIGFMTFALWFLSWSILLTASL
ncbi:MAG: hypothetical protein ACOCYZ_02225 [Halococcoides sp.]